MDATMGKELLRTVKKLGADFYFSHKVKTVENTGDEVVITAEVAAALVLLESPEELISAIFDDPAQALLAITSIGADMSDEEREESEKIIVPSVMDSASH